MIFDIIIGGKSFRLELTQSADGWQCCRDGVEVNVSAVRIGRDVISLLIDGNSYQIRRETTTSGVYVWVGSERYAVEVRDSRSARNRRPVAIADDGPRKVVAQMPGKIVRIMVAEKSTVELGQGILVVEAMKMQNEIKSPRTGVIQRLMVSMGQNVNPGDVLAVVE